MLASAFGWQNAFEVQATSGSPIPAAFDKNNSQSLVMTGIIKNVPATLCVWNETASRVALNTVSSSTSTPSVVTHRIPANSYLCTTDKMSAVYIQGDQGTITDNNYIHGYVK